MLGFRFNGLLSSSVDQPASLDSSHSFNKNVDAERIESDGRCSTVTW